MIKYLLLLIITYTIVGCESEQSKTIRTNFDSRAWKADRGGCLGKRAILLPAFKSIKNAIKGLGINECVQIFGKPDIQQLDERDQKNYLYFWEAGPHCQQFGANSSTPNVLIKFNAMGLAKEVVFQQGIQ